MLLDDLREKLKEVEPAINIIKQFWQSAHIDERKDELEKTSQQESFWQNPDQIVVLKELQVLKERSETYYTLMEQQASFYDLLTLFEEDEKEIENLKDGIYRHIRAIKDFKIILLLNDPKDNQNCFLTINAGAGGTESQDWSEMLLRMYIRFCEREGMNASIVDMQTGEGAGIKSATLFIKGKWCSGLLKSEHGIHRLVRISPFDASKRRHTSFSGVFILPEAPNVTIEIDPEDLRIDTFRAGGAGGQHVNKTDSAIRITHIPSGIVVQCQSERSQTQNKETALKMLKAKLVQKAEDERKASESSIEKKSIEWGSQIRSYVLHPYKMVKDHRTDFESMQPEKVLDGELIEFIEHYLLWIQK